MAHEMPAEIPGTDAWIELPGAEALGTMPADHPYNFGFNAAMYRLIGAHPRIGMSFGRLYARIMFSAGALTRLGREMVAGGAAAAPGRPYLKQSHAEVLRVRGGAAGLGATPKARRWRGGR